MSKLTEVLIQERKRRKLSLRGAGDAIGCAGMAVYYAETGKRPVGNVIDKLVAFYGIDVKALESKPAETGQAELDG